MTRSEKIATKAIRQLRAEVYCTEYGEPQAWLNLKNGRCIEVTSEQEGLPENKRFFSVRLHCSEKEYENGAYRESLGVIGTYRSSNLDFDEIKSLVESARKCDKACPAA